MCAESLSPFAAKIGFVRALSGVVPRSLSAILAIGSVWSILLSGARRSRLPKLASFGTPCRGHLDDPGAILADGSVRSLFWAVAKEDNARNRPEMCHAPTQTARLLPRMVVSSQAWRHMKMQPFLFVWTISWTIA
jgi:hypothetical protein